MFTPWRLYSPANFFVGLHAWLLGRAKLDVSQALAEAERESPRWGYRLAACLVTGLLLLYALFSLLPSAAGPAMVGLSSVATGKQAAVGVALMVGAFMAFIALTALRRFGAFYVRMCLLGQAVRLQG